MILHNIWFSFSDFTLTDSRSIPASANGPTAFLFYG